MITSYYVLKPWGLGVNATTLVPIATGERIGRLGTNSNKMVYVVDSS